MPRGCGCAGNSCGCLIEVGPGLNVSGTGNATEPYLISLEESVPITMGPYTVAGSTADLTNVADGNAIVSVDYEEDIFFKFSDNAGIGTRVEVRLMPSFGAVLTFTGNVWTEVGSGNTIPAPAAGNWWLSAVKMDSFNWFVRALNVEF